MPVPAEWFYLFKLLYLSTGMGLDHCYGLHPMRRDVNG